ncbi:tripartite tricarboxylate transporter substrate binding protein [Diaphorobacter sp. HDW4A]|uniref:Bug family tripartite tricarboxylate transporter substrate binding protein n=1 Tax=Diaphorobacter sp. HDW4A TaxID=2714924 RepID=UPI00140A04A5|nr:tripartite tricarboxylate transporter substrate binding protein [Diaphorobacter sp. HDW4A]QIL82488.1 tripartite tricarboxylate transporter substrate binding protein [Diaphorobacter sp. HDW4A]
MTVRSVHFSPQRRRWSQWALASIATGVLGTTFTAHAQSDAHWPDKPVTLVLGYPAGGINDVIARRLAVELQNELKVTVIVDNRAGANGSIAANYVAKAKPDGYTVMFGAIGQVSVNQFLLAKMPYESGDLIPVGKVADGANVLVVNASKAKQFPSVAKLIEEAKRDPDKLNYGSFGTGSSSHLSAALFAQQAGIKVMHVPYKGSAPAMTDLLGGNLDFMFDSINTALPHIKAGKIVPLAVTKAQRSIALPNIPTFVESGLPNFTLASWFGLHLPKGTPEPIVVKLNAALHKVQAKPDFIEYFKAQNIDITPSTPKEYGDFVASEDRRWGALIKELGIKID